MLYRDALSVVILEMRVRGVLVRVRERARERESARTREWVRIYLNRYMIHVYITFCAMQNVTTITTKKP